MNTDTPSPVRYIFILSAMRSGSTLLQHIAGQQEHVLSAGETKIEYTSPQQLTELQDYLFDYQDIPPEKRDPAQWVFLEKCVHPRYLPEITPAVTPQTRFLFILRHPHPSLSSLLEQKNWPYTESTEAALFYYKERLQQLINLATALPDPRKACFLTYEDLLRNPETHLAKLTAFLGMPSPLRQDYRSQKWTAKLSLGDVSENIRKREIIPNQRRDLVELTSAQHTELDNLYQATCQKLASLCKGSEQIHQPDAPQKLALWQRLLKPFRKPS